MFNALIKQKFIQLGDMAISVGIYVNDHENS